MKTIVIFCFLILYAFFGYAQERDEMLGKPEETESGQIKTDTSTNRTITGSAYGAPEEEINEADSIKTQLSDTVIIEPPARKKEE
ncbi:MAG TPA: hypothetical protein VD908_09030 [Cytophagales bacterium]|nr:hypothetical protein [Cytophagales bacterium]